MKKMYILIFMFVLLFLDVNRVNASYSCGYNLHKRDVLTDWNLYIDYTVDGDKISFSSRHGADSSNFSVIDVMDFYLDKSYKNLSSDEKIKKLTNFMNGKCEKQVYVCKGHGRKSSDSVVTDEGDSFSVLFDLQYQVEAHKYSGEIYAYNGKACLNSSREHYDWYDEINKVGSTRLHGCMTLYDGNNDCFLVNLYEDTTSGKVVDSINTSICVFYDDKVSAMETQYNDCKDKSLCYDYNSMKNEIKSYCNFTLQYTNYNNPCLNSCFKLGDKIAEIENTNFGGSTCNVSDKIWLWIANIFKWAKYFAPVLVIVLGILDFIKAIASQSDDEMKKAQGRFVKRLIAALMLFIIPFIIEFALNAFHLVTDNPYCSLI